VSRGCRAQLHPAGDLDAVLKRLAKLNELSVSVTAFEAEMVSYAQAGL
jgi:hypothetical protein